VHPEPVRLVDNATAATQSTEEARGGGYTAASHAGPGLSIAMHKKLIVFDIDGTLLQSITTHQLALTQAMAASSLTHRDPEWSHYANHTDSGVFYEAYELSFGRQPSEAECRDFEALFQGCYDGLSEGQVDFEIPGAVAMLRQFEASGEWLIAYATGSYRGPAEHKLQRLGVASRSSVLVTASEFRTRRDIVADAIRQRFAGGEHGHRGHVFSVGDGAWDARTAAELGLHFVGVGNERSAPQLIELGARAVVADFTDLPRFLSALEID
jgi:phosphoglycolate phosphatase-like HAD superfamily hydrolase